MSEYRRCSAVLPKYTDKRIHTNKAVDTPPHLSLSPQVIKEIPAPSVPAGLNHLTRQLNLRQQFHHVFNPVCLDMIIFEINVTLLFSHNRIISCLIVCK